MYATYTAGSRSWTSHRTQKEAEKKAMALCRETRDKVQVFQLVSEVDSGRPEIRRCRMAGRRP